ncbi:MAG: hypothetical protein ACQES4_09530, partial [Bacillota bacterium]
MWIVEVKIIIIDIMITLGGTIVLLKKFGTSNYFVAMIFLLIITILLVITAFIVTAFMPGSLAREPYQY